MYVWFILTFVGCALHNCYRICMWSHRLNIVLILTLTLLSLRVWWDGLWMVLICTSLSLDADYEHVWIPQLLLVIGCTVDVEKTQWVKVMEKQGFRQELQFIPNLCTFLFLLWSTKPRFLPHSTYSFSFMKNAWLSLFREIMLACESHIKHLNTACVCEMHSFHIFRLQYV